MKADKININALKFGIMCNFTPFCGEERARESVELIMELERLAEIGRATEIALNHGFFVYENIYNFEGHITDFNHDDTVEELLQWLDLAESEE